MIVDSVLELIGKTPMIKFQNSSNDWELYLKLEKSNPGQSIKDRAALKMVFDAEANGTLKPGGTIIESSSGNMAVGLAIIAAVRGYKFLAILDPSTPDEKINMIRAYGAEVIIIKPSDEMDVGPALAQREKYASDLAKRTPNSVYMEQHNNPSNTAAYPGTLVLELLADVPDFDLLFGAIGTSGSICGTSKGLRESGHTCKVIAVEPKGSIFFSDAGGSFLQSGTGNPPGAELPRILDRSLIDEGLQVTDVEAFCTCRVVARKFGVLLGGSAGGVLFKAHEYLQRLNGKGKAIVLAADGGERYTSTIYDDKWMSKNHLLNFELEDEIARGLHQD
ncbi:MAG: cysteine synthase family protein [Nitrososphaerales archaeon]